MKIPKDAQNAKKRNNRVIGGKITGLAALQQAPSRIFSTSRGHPLVRCYRGKTGPGVNGPSGWPERDGMGGSLGWAGPLQGGFAGCVVDAGSG